MSRPTEIFEWATDEFDTEGNPLKVMPPSEVAATGTLKNQPIFRLWWNAALNNFGEWIKYLEGKDPVGTIKMFATGTFADDGEASIALGGSWTIVDSNLTIGTSSVDVYEKILE